jgi:hypothetical protein
MNWIHWTGDEPDWYSGEGWTLDIPGFSAFIQKRGRLYTISVEGKKIGVGGGRFVMLKGKRTLAEAKKSVEDFIRGGFSSEKTQQSKGVAFFNMNPVKKRRVSKKSIIDKILKFHEYGLSQRMTEARYAPILHDLRKKYNTKSLVFLTRTLRDFMADYS